MPMFKPTKLTRKEIKQNESTVNPRQARAKQEKTTIPPNELILSNYKRLANQVEIFNLIDNHSRENERGPIEKGKEKIIFHFTTPQRTISIGRQLTNAFKGASIKISLSKVNKEVKVYVDFNKV